MLVLKSVADDLIQTRRVTQLGHAISAFEMSIHNKTDADLGTVMGWPCLILPITTHTHSSNGDRNNDVCTIAIYMLYADCPLRISACMHVVKIFTSLLFCLDLIEDPSDPPRMKDSKPQKSTKSRPASSHNTF